MHILRRITAEPTNHDLLTLIVPLQDRAWADAKLPANVGRYRDLPLCGELRTSDWHGRYITTVMNVDVSVEIGEFRADALTVIGA